MVTLLGFACFLVVYFASTIVAALRGHNTGGGFIVNLMLGWTGVGWCVALVMACGSNERRRARLG